MKIRDAARLYKGEHLLTQFADLSKAKEDEGKSPESKAKNRSLRNSRNIEGKPKSESGRSLRSQSKIADRVSQVRFGAPSRPGEKVRGEPKKLEESHGVHVRQATYAPKERNKAGDKATGAMSEKGGQKSWRSGGQYHRRGGERQAHEDVMYGIKASKPNLPKAEMDSPPTSNSQGFKNVDSGTMKKDEKKGYAIKKDGKPNFKLPMKDGKVDGSKIPKKNRAPGWNYAEGKEEVKKAADRNPDWQKEYKNKAVKSPKSRLVSGGEIARGVHGEHYKGRPGESTVGMQIRDKASMMLTPKERHQQKLAELKAQPKPNLPKAELDEKALQAPQKRDQGAEIRAANRAKWAKRTARWDKWKADQKKPKLDKAREDEMTPPEARGQYRQERRKFEPRDHMADDLTSEKGVSDTGIEVRRADKRNPGVLSHGYARVQEPEKHKQNAAARIRERLAMARMNRAK